jgi:hypothetical protein
LIRLKCFPAVGQSILANLHIFFRPASLFNTIAMLVLLVGGLGLIARGIQPHGKQSAE